MARKTFGRGGQPIVVDEDTIGNAPREVEFESLDGVPVTIDGNGNIDELTSESNGTSNGASGDSNEVGHANSSIDPTTLGTGKKPRKPRGPNKAKQGTVQTPSFVTANLEKLLINLHFMASGLLAEPELVIDADEAKLLADAVGEVAKAYNFAAVLSPKTQATVDMAIVLVTVYGDRAWRIAHKAKRNIKNVTPISTQVK